MLLRKIGCCPKVTVLDPFLHFGHQPGILFAVLGQKSSPLCWGNDWILDATSPGRPPNDMLSTIVL